MVHQDGCYGFAQRTAAGAKGIARCGSHRAGLGGEPGSRCPMGRIMLLQRVAGYCSSVDLSYYAIRV